MLKSLKFLAIAAMTLVIGAGTGHATPVIGEAAPDFTATDVHGETVTLSELKGKNVVLEWTNHGCPFVVKHYETNNMQTLQQEATAKDVVWITIVSSAEGKQGYTTAEEAIALMEQQGSHETMRVLDPEGEIGQVYEAKTTPHMFVINKEGTLVYMGAIDDNSSPRHDTVESAKNYVRAALEDLEAGRDVEVSSSRPYGCGVKYKTMF